MSQAYEKRSYLEEDKTLTEGSVVSLVMTSSIRLTSMSCATVSCSLGVAGGSGAVGEDGADVAFCFTFFGFSVSSSSSSYRKEEGGMRLLVLIPSNMLTQTML